MRVEYDKKADAIYIYLADAPYAYGRNLDHERRIDFAEDGTPIGVELLCVSEGVITNDLPHRGEIERLLVKHHIRLPA